MFRLKNNKRNKIQIKKTSRTQRKMIIRIHNNNSTDYADYEEDSVEKIREKSKFRRKSPGWDKGWSEIIKK